MLPDPDYDLISADELNRQMMPRVAVPDHERWLTGDLARGEKLRHTLPGRYDQRYGPGPRQIADLFPAPESAGGRSGRYRPNQTARTAARVLIPLHAPASGRASDRVCLCGPRGDMQRIDTVWT